ncbi:LysR family transcriptional regulator [Marinicella meishanensis]|uniref:LysR family transcriptional regulator n=1 Tax=Marinicella meishanensis TaxID=2873263 RepID=UPI001CBC1351|nr:LysR family transcriptional regulator [Marinicella sp. NBU2979]
MHSIKWELKHLHTLQLMEQTESITAAADRLFLTQSSLSRRILKLEALLGVQLFERIGKRMIMTAAGKRLLALANQIMPLCEEADRDLVALTQPNRPTVRIATQCFTCYHWLPSVIKACQEHTRAEVVAEATDDPNRALLAGEIDLSIANRPCDHRQVTSTPLFTDEYLAVISKDHPWARREYIMPDDCRDEHFFQYAQASRAMDEFLKPQQIQPKQVSAVPLTGSIMQLVRAGLGASFLSEWVLGGKRSGLDWVAKPLGQAGLFRQWYASHLTTQTPNITPLLMALIETNPVQAELDSPHKSR